MSPLKIRVMTEQDLPGADHLRRLAGWNQTVENWQRLLDLAPAGCFVATREETLVGTVTTTSYGSTLAWIGMMLVHPDERRKGIATQLMRQALAHLDGAGVKTLKLDATPAGRPLYEKLGFVAESSLTRRQLERVPTAAVLEGSSSLPRALGEQDWPGIKKIDSAAFGVERLRVLRAFAAAGRRALVWPAIGPISSWGLLRAGAVSDYLGPVVCPGQNELMALLSSLLADVSAHTVTWDIPDDNMAARQVADRLGFQTVRPLTRMRLGPPVPASAPENVCAIVDPAVG